MTTVHEIFDRMPETFLKEKAAGMDAVIEFDITGDGGGRWHAVIAGERLSVVRGPHPSPHLTLSASAEDYVAISTGKLNGQLAFMTGRLKASGDLALAVKMQNVFKQPARR